MMNGWETIGWGWMALWTVLAILLATVLAYAAIQIVTALKAPDRPESAQAVLRRRYAAGEIDEAEFNRRRLTLDDWRQEVSQ